MEESQPQPGTLLPRRDPYPQSLHISTVTNLANNASAKKYAHGFNSHLSRYNRRRSIFVAKSFYFKFSCFSFTSEISLLTQRKRPLAAPRSVEVQLPALRPGVRIQGWSRNRWGRCRWRAKRAIYGAGIHSGSNIWRGRGNTLALMPTNPPSHRAMNKHMSPTIPDIRCGRHGQCCKKLCPPTHCQG